jgi:endonuclease YncB( thermonuclease family)
VSAIVASVYDGDTLTMTNGERVRLLQIDTPELGSGECYSRGRPDRAPEPRARRQPRRARGPRGARQDRPLRKNPPLIRRAGVNVNVELVRCGAAAPYFYRDQRGRYARALLAAALAAKAEKARPVA